MLVFGGVIGWFSHFLPIFIANSPLIKPRWHGALGPCALSVSPAACLRTCSAGGAAAGRHVVPGRDNCGDFGGVFARNRGMGLVYVRGCHNLVKVGTINNIIYSHIYSFYEGNPYSPSLSTESIRVFSTTLELFSPKSWEVKRDCFPVSFFLQLGGRWNFWGQVEGSFLFWNEGRDIRGIKQELPVSSLTCWFCASSQNQLGGGFNIFCFYH